MADADTATLYQLVQERYQAEGRKPGKARRHNPQKPCQHDGCEKWAWAQGYCDNHYQKLKRQGIIQPKRKVNDPVGRFHASYMVNPESGCWEWTAWLHPKGYGVIPVGGASKKVRAHRFSWELHRGPIPDGLFPCHSCDNRKCVNPDHLFLGDDRANVRDMVAKGRDGARPGEPRDKLSPSMAMNIRVMFARGQHSMVALARIYGLDHRTVSDVVRGRSHLG